MPLTSNLEIDIFDVWGIDFMGPFNKNEDKEHILVVVDYVSGGQGAHLSGSGLCFQMGRSTAMLSSRFQARHQNVPRDYLSSFWRAKGHDH